MVANHFLSQQGEFYLLWLGLSVHGCNCWSLSSGSIVFPLDSRPWALSECPYPGSCWTYSHY